MGGGVTYGTSSLVHRILESYDSLSLSYEPRILEEKTADMCSGGARRGYPIVPPAPQNSLDKFDPQVLIVA